MSRVQDYNAHAPRADGLWSGRGIVGGVGAETWDQASQYVGRPLLPGNVASNRTERVRIRTLLDLVYENWIPFTAWVTARFIGPRPQVTPWESPVSFHGAGEIITRGGPFPSGERPFPYPYMIGAVSGFMPMLDSLSMSFAWGKTPSGPGVLTPVPIPWDAQYPQLPKTSG